MRRMLKERGSLDKVTMTRVCRRFWFRIEDMLLPLRGRIALTMYGMGEGAVKGLEYIENQSCCPGV
jgi:hypothetical protein